MPKVMVVDDAATARTAVVRLLKREGYETVSAAGGREALKLLEGAALPDLILLDVMMPDLDGLHVLELLHDDPRWKALPVVMLTAVSDTHTVRRCEQLGAKAFLVKAAFSVAEVLDQVHRYAPMVGPAGSADAGTRPA